MIHIPILRHGVPYESLDIIRIPHHRSRETFAEMSQANGGPIATNVISWDQPHEGNLFEHLCARRSFQAAVAF
jgi:hypothetical protein